MVYPTSSAVHLRGVTARYASTTALANVDLDIPAHRTTALVGPNGSGKSTLLGILAGLHPPTHGTVWRGHTERPALVLQRSAVSDALPITVRDTVAMGRWAHLGPWRRRTSADLAVVTECMKRLGIGELAQRPLGSLSGGQRQRTLLAQGLAQRSDLLLLDEPDAGLDSAAQETILDLLAEIRAEGTTIVHATHSPQTALRADHRIDVHEGRIVTTTMASS